MTTAVLVLGGVTVGAGGTTLTATTIAAPGGSADPINFLNWIPGQGQEGAPAGHIVFGPAGQVGVITHAVNATTVALAAPWVGAALAGGTCQLIFSINALPIGRQATIIANIVALRPLLKSNNLSEYLGDATAQAAVLNNIGALARLLRFDAAQALTDPQKAQARTNIGLPTTATTITNWNDALTTGWAMSDSAANAPAAGWFIAEIVAHNDQYVTQTAWAFTSAAAGDSQAWRRWRKAGVWTAWTRVRLTQSELDARYQAALGFTPVQQGGGAGQGSSKVHIGWNGALVSLLAQVDAVDLGRLWTDYSTGVSPGILRLPNKWMLQYAFPILSVDSSGYATGNWPTAFASGPISGAPFMIAACGDGQYTPTRVDVAPTASPLTQYTIRSASLLSTNVRVSVIGIGTAP